MCVCGDKKGLTLVGDLGRIRGLLVALPTRAYRACQHTSGNVYLPGYLDRQSHPVQAVEAPPPMKLSAADPSIRAERSVTFATRTIFCQDAR